MSDPISTAVAASVPGSNSALKSIALNAGIAVALAAGQAAVAFLPVIGTAAVGVLPVFVQPYAAALLASGIAAVQFWLAKKAKDNHIESVNAAVAMPASAADAAVAKAYGK
jgi:hypothetical protein